MAAKKKSKRGYSYNTSLPAYKENREEKRNQARKILSVIKRRSTKKATILEIKHSLARIDGIHLPQSTVSARVNDLIYEGLVGFFGKTKIYKNRKRNLYELITAANKHLRSRKASKRRKDAKPSLYQYNRRIGCHIITLTNGRTYISIDKKKWYVQKTSNAKRKGTTNRRSGKKQNVDSVFKKPATRA